MNKNKIVTNEFSNPDSENLYKSGFETEPELREKYLSGSGQCGGCSFYAKFNTDWGLCCHSKSRHHLETVFEHFTCPVHVSESWQYHSFLDYNAVPEVRKQYELLYELPEWAYDTAGKIAKETDTEFYMVIWNALKRGLESLSNKK